MPSSSRLLTLQQWAARAYRALRMAAAHLPVRLALFSLLALVARWPSLSGAAGLNDFRDAHYLHQYEDAARRAVVQFHQIPLWDPYYCGGLYELGSPQTRYVSPGFLATLLLGTTRAEPVLALLMMILGMEGAYRYARARKASSLGAMWAAPVFGLSGVFAYSLRFGWVHFYGFALAPWVLWGLRRALRGSRTGLVAAAIAIAWMVGFGGTYAAPLTAVFCGLECLEALVVLRRHGTRIARAGWMAAAVVLTAAGLSAVRLWPLAETLLASPRLLNDRPGVRYPELLAYLFGSAANRADGLYLIGLVMVPVALLGLLRRRAWWLAAAIAMACWLATGYATRPSLFDGLRHIPIYGMLRYPERFLVLLALAASALAALGMHSLQVLARRRPAWIWAQWAALGLLAYNAVLLVRYHRLEQERTSLMIAPVEVQRPFVQARGNRWLAAYYPAMSRGTLSCFDDFDVPQSPLLRGDLAQEEYLVDPSAGSVERRSWSPNRIVLQVKLARQGRVRINQNYHPGWHTSTGTVSNDLGLLAVDLPAGEHEVTLRFLPESAAGGIAISLASLAVLVWIVRERLRKGDTAPNPRAASWLCAASAVPVAAGALYALVLRPCRPTPPVLITPSGEPAIAASLPLQSRPLAVRFENGVRLEGANVHFDGSGVVPRLLVELDFVIPENVPPGLGVFVHLRAPDGKTHTMDHVRLASAVPFERAPRNTILRDIGAWELVDKPAGRWTITAGLWMARGGGKRVKIADRGKASVRDDAITIGQVQTMQVSP